MYENLSTLQKSVVDIKVKDGYSVIGATRSLLNGMIAVVLVKKRHTVVVNTLGYDEHFTGKTWNIEEEEK